MAGRKDVRERAGPRDPDPAPGGPDEGIGRQTDDEVGADPEDATVADWVEADSSRPTLPEETADGLDDTGEEVRHQAEDDPLDTPGRLR